MDISVWIDRHAGFTPDKTAINFAGRDITYGQLAKRIGLLAGVLRHCLNVKTGDRVAYLGFNHPDTIALLFASARIGAILMPMNWRLEAAEHSSILKDSTPTVLFVEAGYEAHGRQICENTDTRLIGLDGQGDNIEALDKLLESAEPLGAAEATGGYDDPVLICYTSGATGLPKGVVLDQHALLINAINSTHMHAMTGDDVVLTTLPLFHVGGMNIQTLPILHAGGRLVLHPAFDLAQTFAALQDDGTTLTVLVPTQIMAMASDERWAAASFPSLRMITTGSTLVPMHLIKKVHEKQAPLIQVYGSTETAPIATYLTFEDARANEGSLGKPALHCDMRIIDDAGNDVEPGQSGEILIRGGNIMCRYWNAPETTAEVLKNGWYHTGDIGHLDADGFLYMDDRKKDMIISGGENIYPAELENILAECPHIAEAAVVGERDDKWGEVVVAMVVSMPKQVIESSDVIRLFDGRLARYKHPRRVVFLERLPRNAMGKIQKDALRELLEKEPGGRHKILEGTAP